MRFKNIFIISLVLLTLISLSCVCAAEDVNETLNEDAGSEILDTGQVEIDLEEGDVFDPNDEDDTIDIEFPDDDDEDVTGILTVYLDGKQARLQIDSEDEEVYYVLNTGTANTVKIDGDCSDLYLSLSKLTPGSYLIEVDFKCTSNHISANKKANITVGESSADEIEIEVDEDDVFISGEENIVYITVPSTIINSLNVKINQTTYTYVKDSTTSVYVDISNLGEGRYQMTVTGGNLSASATIVVSNGISYPEEMEYKSQQYISLTLPQDASGNLTITDDYNNIIFNQALENGYAGYSLSNLEIGEYSFIAYYTGEDYEIEEEDIDLTVFPKITYPTTMTAGEKKYLTIDAGSASGMLYIEADGEAYAYVEVKGSKSISLADLEDGEIDLDMTFTASNDDSFDMDCTIMVNSVKPKITGAKNLKMTYTKPVTIKVALYGTNAKLAEKGEYAEVKIGKKTYATSSDIDGRVKFKIPKSLTPGKYKIKITYDGVSVEKTLVVKHLLKLKKSKVKASAKKLVLKAKVKGVKNKKVTFKFNGKKFKTKTNKKGVAKVTVNSNILKKLKAGKKVTYKATYLKDTVKKTVKVKK